MAGQLTSFSPLLPDVDASMPSIFGLKRYLRKEALYALKPTVLCTWTGVKLGTARRSKSAAARAASLSALMLTLGGSPWLACSLFLAAVSAAGCWRQGDHCYSLLTYAAVPIWFKLASDTQK